MDICKKCGQPMQTGELITGQSWNGDGGEHISCPDVIAAAPAFLPPQVNPYFDMVMRATAGAK